MFIPSQGEEHAPITTPIKILQQDQGRQYTMRLFLRKQESFSDFLANTDWAKQLYNF